MEATLQSQKWRWLRIFPLPSSRNLTNVFIIQLTLYMCNYHIIRAEWNAGLKGNGKNKNRKTQLRMADGEMEK